MNPNVIITCAVTGAGDTVGKHPAIPVTPEQIANAALEAAERNLAAGIEAEQQAELAAIAERTGRELARLRSLPDSAITSMADSLLDLALTLGPEDAA